MARSGSYRVAWPGWPASEKVWAGAKNVKEHQSMLSLQAEKLPVAWCGGCKALCLGVGEWV